MTDMHDISRRRVLLNHIRGNKADSLRPSRKNQGKWSKRAAEIFHVEEYKKDVRPRSPTKYDREKIDHRHHTSRSYGLSGLVRTTYSCAAGRGCASLESIILLRQATQTRYCFPCQGVTQDDLGATIRTLASHSSAPMPPNGQGDEARELNRIDFNLKRETEEASEILKRRRDELCPPTWINRNPDPLPLSAQFLADPENLDPSKLVI